MRQDSLMSTCRRCGADRWRDEVDLSETSAARMYNLSLKEVYYDAEEIWRMLRR
jgi:hypothetical protein